MKNSDNKKEFNTSVIIDRSVIAPCGMNCGSCIGYMRPDNKCYGCWQDDEFKRNSCVQCVIKKCDLLEKTESKFCYECPKYPCRRLKQLDKRYKTKYHTSFLDNLSMIRDKGIDYFLDFETNRRKCPNCGSTLSVHRDNCLDCFVVIKYNGK